MKKQNVPVGWEAENIVFDSEPELHFYVSKLEKPSICYSYDKDDFQKNLGYQAIERGTYHG